MGVGDNGNGRMVGGIEGGSVAGDRTRMNNNPLYDHGHSLSLQQRQQQQRLMQHPQWPLLPRQHQQYSNLGYANSSAAVHNAGAGYGNNSHSGYTHSHARNSAPNDSTYSTSPQATSSLQEAHSQTTATTLQQLAIKKGRVRSVLFLAALAFMGMLVLDGLLQFTDLSTTVHDSVESAVDIIDGYERSPSEANSSPGFLRRLMDSLLDDTVVPPHRSYSNELNPEQAHAAASLGIRQHNQPQRALHTLPLLPKHALQHRQRRELIANSLPIPEHLQEGIEDELYHAENAHRRRRMYPVLHHENKDSSSLQNTLDEMKLGRNMSPPSAVAIGTILQLILRWHCRLLRE